MSSPAIQSWQAAFEAQAATSADQRRAFTEFLARGLPTTKLDEWKYTDLRRLALRQFRTPSENTVAVTAIEPFLLPLQDCHRIVFVDGRLVPALSVSRFAGVSVIASTPTLPRANGSRAFELLNAALASQSVRVDVDDDVCIDNPIYVAWIWTQTATAAMIHPQLSISLGRNAKATLIEHHAGANADANLTNTVANIKVGQQAMLEHIRVQDDAAGNFNIGGIHIDVARGASYRNFNYVVGGALARTDIDVRLTETDASAELHGLIFAHETRHLDVRTCIEHQAANTRSREDYRGIADHRGRVVFNGKVIVAKDAQHTDAAQSSRNLLLSPHAEIDTRPELEIYANDVKCAHGATVGQLDAGALFYLQSRGIEQHEARALLTHAFAAELIERAPVAAVREYVLARLMQRMRSVGGTQ